MRPLILLFAGFVTTVSVQGTPSSAGPRNCPLAYDKTPGGSDTVLVAMSNAERRAFQGAMAYARKAASGDELTRLAIIDEALKAMSDLNSPGTGRSRRIGTAPAKRSTDEILADIKRRAKIRIRKMRLDAEGKKGEVRSAAPAGGGRSLEPDKAEKQRQLLAMLARQAEQGIRPKVWAGELDAPTFGGPFFQSSVAIVDPSNFDGINIPLARKAFCSATRISQTAFLTAAHCVCQLQLDVARNAGVPAPQVRIGNESRKDAWVAKADVVTSKTVCFSKTNQSCQRSFCRKFKRDAGITPSLHGKDVALVFVKRDQISQAPQIWQRISKLATTSDSDLKKAKIKLAGERLFLIGSGFDPTSEKGPGSDQFGDASLGIKRCGQLTLGPRCGARLPCDRKKEMHLVGDEGAGGAGGARTDACPGDSGGGVFVMDNTKAPKQFHLVGVVSRGPRIAGKPFFSQCSSKGSVYTVPSDDDVLKWIKRHVPEVGMARGDRVP